jgi:phosphatidylglycerophosphatase A
MQSPQKRTPWAWTVATFFGFGNLKPGPGTYGSVAAILLWLAIANFLRPNPHEMLAITIAGVILSTAIGVPASTIVAREAGREDPGFVVIDEVAGQLLTCVALTPTLIHAALALLLFRLFDIFKPWPIRKFEAFPEGHGIMYDDLAAGAIALAVTQLLVHFVPALR